jgi:hypothetical protein
LIYKNRFERLSFSFAVDEFKSELKKQLGDSTTSFIKYEYLIDSLCKQDSIPIIDDLMVFKYQTHNNDFLFFDKAVYELFKKKKARAIIDDKRINNNDIKVTVNYYSQCPNIAKSLITKRKKSARSKRWVFWYKGEIVGSLYIETYRGKIVNCF